MRKLPALVCGIAALLTAGVTAQQPSVYTPLGALPVLDVYLESLRQQAGIPGMSAAIVSEGTVIWEHGYGFENTNSRVRATPDTPYLVGDISGTLAAVMLLECVEQRKIEIDQPIREYGAEGAEAGSTVRELLSHTSANVPDEPFAYNPERYAHLTAVVEFCTKEPYRKSASARLLERFAMRDSVPGLDMRRAVGTDAADEWFDAGDYDRYRRVLERMALPYKVDSRGRAERTELPVTPMNAAGGLVSTVRDLARLQAAVDSDLLLRDDTRALAWTPVVSSHGVAAPMGLGWFVQGYRGERLVWHFGLVPNAYSSLILKLPARHLTFILLANSDGLSAPFQLGSGDVTRSLFATLFLRLVT
jgi:CubicO group peptidase (beta-lactamase class C family)